MSFRNKVQCHVNFFNNFFGFKDHSSVIKVFKETVFQGYFMKVTVNIRYCVFGLIKYFAVNIVFGDLLSYYFLLKIEIICSAEFFILVNDRE